MSSADDLRWMQAALRLARRGLGNVWPNPAVGCVILASDGQAVLGRGWTQPGGRPHAETQALDQAQALAGGERVKGATAYVTLEPCDHHGQTPPCAERLIAAGIKRVVVGCGDSDPRVNGRGIAKLRQAGIEVLTGVGEADARRVNGGYFLHREQGRPLVTLKTATSLDGRIAMGNGRSRWITGEASRARAHLLRARHDAVAVGVSTALADNPELTIRLPGVARRSQPRVIFDSRLRLPLTSRLVAGARDAPLWVIARPDPPAERAKALVDLGVEVLFVEADPATGRTKLSAGLSALAGRGITRLLVEGGGELAANFLAANLIDEIAWFRAPMLIGGDGLPVLAGFGLNDLAAAPRFNPVESIGLDNDVLETFRRRD